MEASESTSAPDKPTMDDVLPRGVYNLRPNLYPEGYLTWVYPRSVTGNGKDPESPLCRWIVFQRRSKSWIRTLFSIYPQPPPPEVNPWLKIDSDELQTARNPRNDPTCNFIVQSASPNVRFRSDIYPEQYIGVNESGEVIRPPEAGARVQTSMFAATNVTEFFPSGQDFDMKTCHFVCKVNGKAFSVQSNGQVILVPKPFDETIHFKLLKTDDNRGLYTIQSVAFPTLNVRGNADDTVDSDKKGTLFAIMETAEPVSYALFAPVYLKFMCVKNESEMEMNVNPLPPGGDSTPLTSGPGFFDIVIVS